MKSFNLKKDSWHFWLANKCGGLDYWEGYDVLDICTYSQKVLKGLFIFVFLTIFAAMIGIAYLVGGYDLFLCLLNPVCLEAPPSSMVFLAINGIIALFFMVACGVVGVEKYRDYLYEHPVDKKDPSFLTLWYRKLKDKTCVLINLE